MVNMAENRGPEGVAVIGLFLALTCIFVSLRIYVKAFLTKSWANDDLLLGVAQIFFIVYCAGCLVAIKNGTGRHVQDISPEDIPTALYFWLLGEIMYTVTLVFIRLSVAVFLLRICIKPIHKIIIYGTMVMVIVYSTFYFFLVIFQCHPVSYFWLQYGGMKGSCLNPAVVPDASIAHSAVNFTADWILALLPIALLWHLQMNFRTKVSVAAVLAMGLSAGIATMIRVPYIKVLGLTDDFLFATADVAIWSIIEPGLGIVATAAATLRPLFRRFYSLSSRGTNQQSTQPASRWRNNHAGYMQNNNDVEAGAQTYQNSKSQTDGRGIQLQSNIMGQGNTTSVKSPFGDSREAVGDGIKVHRTIEISRVEDSDDDSDPGTKWPIQSNRQDSDIV